MTRKRETEVALAQIPLIKTVFFVHGYVKYIYTIWKIINTDLKKTSLTNLITCQNDNNCADTLLQTRSSGSQ